jgi:hypothetical protein
MGQGRHGKARMGDAQSAYFLSQNGCGSIYSLPIRLAHRLQAGLFNAFIKNELVDLPHTSVRCRIIGRAAIGTLASGLLGRLFDSPISM